MTGINGYLTASELKKMIRNGEDSEFLIIDLRDEKAYHEDHIDGAVNVPYQEFMSQKSYELLIQRLTAKKRFRRGVILYCERGGSSIYAAKRLASAGVSPVFSLSGGFKEFRLL